LGSDKVGRAKVWLVGEGERMPLIAERLFQRETVQGVDRLVVSAESGWCDLALKLVAVSGSSFSCLYEERDTEAESRHESHPMSLPRLSQLVDQYREFLESDPRHNFWLYNHDTQRQVVLDEHNHLFVYGDLEAAIELLTEDGFRAGLVELPTPHVHLYSESGSSDEMALIAELRTTR